MMIADPIIFCKSNEENGIFPKVAIDNQFIMLFLISYLFLVPLAYLMAKAHGLEDYEKTLEESLRQSDSINVEKVME